MYPWLYHNCLFQPEDKPGKRGAIMAKEVLIQETLEEVFRATHHILRLPAAPGCG